MYHLSQRMASQANLDEDQREIIEYSLIWVGNASYLVSLVSSWSVLHWAHLPPPWPPAQTLRTCNVWQSAL